MYIFRRILFCSFLFLGLASYAHSSSADSDVAARGGAGGVGHSNEMYSGNRFDAGGNAASNRMYSGNATDRNMGQSNQIYSGNRFDNEFYRGVQGNDPGLYNYAPPVYGYGYYGSAPLAPNSQIFPDDAEANALYWGEVKQMEQQ